MREADLIIQEAEQEFSILEFQEDPAAIFGHNARFLQIGKRAVMGQACPVLRKKFAKNRAEALEMAYDFLLNRTTKGTWMRVGEVRINRPHDVVEALCQPLPNDRKVQIQ